MPSAVWTWPFLCRVWPAGHRRQADRSSWDFALAGLPYHPPSKRSGFERNRSRKQDVVFEMDVLMQIGFEFLQPVIERLIAHAGIRRRGVAAGQFSGSAQRFAG